MSRVSIWSGKVRNPPPRGQRLHEYEIDVGQSVMNDWDKVLVETWEERKARLALLRAAGAGEGGR